MGREETRAPVAACALTLPHVWRLAALALLGAAVLTALVGGSDPSPFFRQTAALACVSLGAVALAATLRRCSGLGEVSLLDALLPIALVISAAAAWHAPIRPAAVLALQWQAGLLAAYFAARLIGIFLTEMVAALWVLALLGLWGLRVAAMRAAEPVGLLAHVESIGLDALIEQTTALVILGIGLALVMRKSGRSVPGWGLMARLLLVALVLGSAALHLWVVAGDSPATFAAQRDLGWQMARAVVWDQPLWGWGGGSWHWAAAAIAHPPALDEPFTLGAPDRILAAGGLVGLAAAALVVVGLLTARASARRRGERRGTLAPLTPLIALLLAWAIMGLWSSAPIRPANLIVFAWAAGTALSLHLRRIGAEMTPPSRRARQAVWSTGIAATLLLAGYLALPVALARHIRSASSETEAMDRSAWAAALMPWDAQWPEREASIAGVWAMRDPSVDTDALRTRRAGAFARARRLNPHEVMNYLTASHALLIRGQRGRAEHLLREGIARCPQDDAMPLILANSLELRGDVRGAFEVLRPLDRMSPTGHTRETMARLSFALGDAALAERFAREALQLGRRSPTLRALLEHMESPLLAAMR